MSNSFEAPHKAHTEQQKAEAHEPRDLLLADVFPAKHIESTAAPQVVDESHWRWPMPRASVQQPLDLILTKEEKDRIGKKVWSNESGATFEGLTAWNKGEEFPSLGIGHFIWLPKNAHVPFGQSFPDAMNFVKAEGAKLPAWLKQNEPCPWNTRQEFYNDFNGKKLTELRNFLNDNIAQQTDYLIDRLEKALPEILEKEDPAQRDQIQKRFFTVLNSGPAGVFELVDYTNFKGEGLELVPEYHNTAWGLKQVLEGMKDTNNPVKDFSDSAKAVLTERVKNSPPARNEKQWLQGWLNRVDRYVTSPPLTAEHSRRHS